MMNFQRTAAIAGSGGKALGLAYTVLDQAGFEIAGEGPGTVELRGPRLLGRRRSPFNGARCVRIDVRDGEIRLAADLQGIGWLFLIIAGSLVALGVALAIVMWLQEGSRANPAVLILPLGIWIALLPVLYWWSRRAVVQAYEELLAEMVAAERLD
jgi:hypothetical protein